MEEAKVLDFGTLPDLSQEADTLYWAASARDYIASLEHSNRRLREAIEKNAERSSKDKRIERLENRIDILIRCLESQMSNADESD